MTARRTGIANLPHCPRGLSLEQAAAYVGVTVPTALPSGSRRGSPMVSDHVNMFDWQGVEPHVPAARHVCNNGAEMSRLP
jgi:hypothetical protein